MEDRQDILNQFYNEDCDEDTRLLSKHGKVEFITTDTYVNKYLKEGIKILEVGAGTGRYSLHYAKQGYDVTSVEFVKHNLDVLKSHIEEGMKINAMQGDATNLDMLEDNTFDITLVLGPLYHLYTEEDVDKAIKEAIRVTKPGGVIAFAYLTHDSIMVDWALMGDHLVDRYLISFDENFKMIIDPKEVFTAFYTFEFKKMMEKYNIDFLHNIATDGMTHHVKEKIDSLTDEEFNMWIKYHLHTCEREDLQGYSNHMLYMGRKR